ncbi:ATP-binding protein [Catenuloplanes atrovinosus]|uniref:Orc1-like AAA ATPase domain-containing protein n=1 Tax=Catenuloplanes atrovinosus TaxID=137266 RepID=A0AAE4CD96_9ACTN|nr:ATP-binding protein [Catenuloplanes atrovinosus]MDR7277305.1 hypothetical protein [Catenuloplanes atrovinosus]
MSTTCNESITGVCSVGSQSLGNHIQAARDRAFVGRTRELGLFRAALDPGYTGPAVFFVHGARGSGKSALLRRFGQEATTAGRQVVTVDCHHLRPDPQAFEAAAAEAFRERRALLIDGFEVCDALEDWLWRGFLERLPADTIVVIAGSRPPSVLWQTDPAWINGLRVLRLNALSRDEAEELMARCHVPSGHREALFRFSGGLPLPLTIGCTAAMREPDRPEAWIGYRPGSGWVLRDLIGDVPSSAHRRALEIAALVVHTTEHLLRETCPGDAPGLFAWLRRQPYVEAGERGLRLHDSLRELITNDFRWRDPVRALATARQVGDRLMARVAEASGTTALLSLIEAIYLRRSDPGIRRLMAWSDHAGVQTDGYRPGDHAHLHRMAAEAGYSAAIVEFWLHRQPRAFLVYRDAPAGRPVGFIAQLELSRRSPMEVRADPFVRAVWEHVERERPLEQGDRIAVHRFVLPPRQHAPSAAQDLLLARIPMSAFQDRAIAWSFTHLARGGPAAPLLRLFGHHRLDGEQGAGFAHDWRAIPPEEWADRLVDRLLDQPTPPPPVTLTRPRFDAAVRDALRDWHNPALLAENPLIGTRLTGKARTQADQVDALRRALATAIRELGGTHRRMMRRTVVEASYLEPDGCRERDAYRLGMSLSTLKRYLRAGIADVADQLWAQHNRPAA